MADVNTERTVVVDRDGDRDATDRRTPVGLIVLLVALVVLALFFLLGGFRMFGGGTGTSTSGGASTQIQTPSTNTAPTTPAQ